MTPRIPEIEKLHAQCETLKKALYEWFVYVEPTLSALPMDEVGSIDARFGVLLRLIPLKTFR